MHSEAPRTGPLPDNAAPPTREELRQLQQALEDLASAQRATEKTARTRQARTFAAVFAGNSLGRLFSSAIEKLLTMNDWFGLFG